MIKKRPAARILLLNPSQQVLLFYTDLKEGYWFTLGGGLEDGETFEAAAQRELFEETGITINSPGKQVYARTSVFALPDGTQVEADERFFIVHAKTAELATEHWSRNERTYIKAYRWWSQEDLQNYTGTVWPENVAEILKGAGVWLY